MKIGLCICTYRRPDGLARLLDELRQLQGEHDLSIFVADNDSEAREGVAVAERLQDYPYPVQTLVVTDPGIAPNRNAAAKAALDAGSELIAFLDDDEWPSPQWLQELLDVMHETGTDAVGGPTLSEFPAEATAEQRRNPYFGADLGLPDRSLCQLQASGNCMISAAAMRKLGPVFFDPVLAMSGGEDLAFFTRLSQFGYRMSWAANAIVYETVPVYRLQDDWMRERVKVIANARVLIMRELEPGIPASMVRWIKTLGLGAVATTLSAAGLASPSLAQRGRMLRWKFSGKLSGHLNRRIARFETGQSGGNRNDTGQQIC